MTERFAGKKREKGERKGGEGSVCPSLPLSLPKRFCHGKIYSNGITGQPPLPPSDIGRKEGRVATGDSGADLRCGQNIHIYLNGAESHMQKQPIDTCWDIAHIEKEEK